jgi:hypothetical protein
LQDGDGDWVDHIEMVPYSALLGKAAGPFKQGTVRR